MYAWLKTNPDAPDLNEAPRGWYKPLPSCTVMGEGEFIKTIFITEVPRKGSVNLDTWKPSPAAATLGSMPTPDERLKAIEEQLNDIKIALAHTFELVIETDEKKKSTIRVALMQLLNNKLRPR